MGTQFNSHPPQAPDTHSGIRVEPAPWALAAPELLAVRDAVFVREQGVPVHLEHDAHDAIARHFIARTADGTPVGTARLLPDAHIGRLAVLAQWRGRGVGRMLMLAALDGARLQGMTHVCLHAQRQAQGFYESLGFVAQGPEFLEAGIPHVLMARDEP